MNRIHKLIFLIVTLIGVLLLEACSSMEQESNSEVLMSPTLSTESTIDTTTISYNDFQTLDIPPEANILYFGLNTIVYAIELENSPNPEYPNQSIYIFDAKENNCKQIVELQNAGVNLGSAVFSDNQIYLAYSFLGSISRLLRFDVKDAEIEVLLEWTEDTLICNTYLAQNMLILHRIEFAGDITNYIIDGFDLNSHEWSHIEKKSCKMGNEVANGTVLACIATDDTHIYGLLKEIDGENVNSFIVSYNLISEKVEMQPFGLEEFESIPDFSFDKSSDIVGAVEANNDTIFSMFSEHGYLIFETLNGRIAMQQRQKSGQLSIVKLPKDLYQNYLSGYHFLEYSGNGAEKAYFMNTYAETNNLYIFDYQTQRISSATLPIDEKDAIQYYRNITGDLLALRINMENDTGAYYIVRASKL